MILYTFLLAFRLCEMLLANTLTITNKERQLIQLRQNVTDLLDTLFDNYDRNMRPGYPGPALVVTVDVSVLSMGPVSEKDMSWTDERLRFSLLHYKNLTKLSLNAVFMLEKMWKPDTYIRNGGHSYLHKLTTPNKLLRISTLGEVYVSQRLTIKAKCPMHLRKFPMDTQACPVEIGSLGYSTKDIIYKWSSINIAEEIQLSQYKLDGGGGILRAERNKSSWHFIYDEYSTLIAHFKLKRQQGYYLLQIYVPCIMTVALSWVSFWINKEAAPGRVALGVMTVLTISTLGLGGEGYRNDLPRVSYSTALDIYMIVCFVFVFSALVEYAVLSFAYIVYVNTMKRKEADEKRRKDRSITSLLASTLTSFPANVSKSKEESTSSHKETSTSAETSFELHEQSDDAIIEETTPLNIPNRAALLYTSEKASHREGLYNNNKQLPGQPVSQCTHKHHHHHGHRRISLGVIDISKRWEKLKQESYNIVDRIDGVSKMLFPVTYITFNLLYWALFLFWIPDEIDTDLIREYGSLTQIIQ